MIPVIPTPLEISGGSSRFPFRLEEGAISCELGLEHVRDWLRRALDSRGAQAAASGTPPLQIALRLGPAPDIPSPEGIAPIDDADDERHTLDITPERVTITGPSRAAILRGAASLLQLVSTGASLPECRIADGPRFAWRGLMVDAARHPFTVGEMQRIVDLLVAYKLNVLHVHLTDAARWRVASAHHPELTDGADALTVADLDALAGYARSRGVTVVPEVDLPGHCAAVVRALPDTALDERAAALGYLDPAAPAARRFLEDAARQVAELSSGAYAHVGGDEPFGMDGEAYRRAVNIVVDAAHAGGARVVAWQEALRSGALSSDDLVQHWIGDENHIDVDAKKAQLPAEAHHFVDEMAALFALAPGDLALAAEADVPVLVSSNDVLYLDRPYAEPGASEEDEARRGRLGFRDYPPKTLRAMYDWTPESLVADGVRIAGLEAAIWSESIESFDDLAFLLLPRLLFVAERAWSRVPADWGHVEETIARHRTGWASSGWGTAFTAADAS